MNAGVGTAFTRGVLFAKGGHLGAVAATALAVGPPFPRVEEPVFAGFSLALTGAFDESDDPGARTSVIGLPRGCRINPVCPARLTQFWYGAEFH